MKLFLVVAMLLLPVTGWGETLYKYEDPDNGKVWMVKTLSKPNFYFWYMGTTRCEAARVDNMVLLQCPGDPDAGLYLDRGDVILNVAGETAATYTRGTILYKMFDSIMKYKL